MTLTLPRLQGVPLASSGSLNVALHRHLGPVTILLSLNPAPDSNPYPQSRAAAGDSLRRTIESKNEDIESIYGLYSDLMKVGDFGVARRAAQPVATTRMGWDLTTMAISDESGLSESHSNGAIYQDGRTGSASGQLVARNRMPLPAGAAQQQQQQQALNQMDPQAAGQSTLGSDGSSSQNPAGSVTDQSKGMLQEELLVNNAASSGVPNAVMNNVYGEMRPLSRRSAGSHGGGQMRRDVVYAESPIGSSGSNSQKTALLLTGGNGYKRGTHDNPYSSQHAHCIIWEYKL